MFTVKGVYDGHVARPQKTVSVDAGCEVMITFLGVPDFAAPEEVIGAPAIKAVAETTVEERLTALNSLVGILQGNTLTLEEAKAERLARQ